ncbi:hypothetical protein JOF53_006301 [Crossiella equi]|uniref:Uncharacterized protein n=2 Tax=Crossiella equi TaxID=130796 RepID=A0ABS5AMK0_9PSEU|nr:hypothetical protein [Crossiella equi]MBP2477429.1 hypothetical protein [Crossiella equi]
MRSTGRSVVPSGCRARRIRRRSGHVSGVAALRVEPRRYVGARISLVPRRIHVAGDIAGLSTLASATGLRPAGEVLRRQPDGRWR